MSITLRAGTATRLRKLQDDYRHAVDRAERARVAYVAALLAERETRTLADIGDELGVTPSRICQLTRRRDAPTESP